MKKSMVIIMIVVAMILGVYLGHTKTYANIKNETVGMVQDYELRKVFVDETEGNGDIVLDRHDLGNYTVYWRLDPMEDESFKDAMFIFDIEFDSIEEIDSEHVKDISAVIDGRYYTWKQLVRKGWIS
ncbi:MAG: hypothetical protein J6U54_05245 [Clostridiales bacterium]|nr:hypothetical protein [Clostridiales bacterium]